MLVEDPRALRRLLWLLSLAAALTVANLYYVQPLLPTIALSLGVSPGATGLVPTVTQVGYAVGMLLVAPLADSLERKRLMVRMTLLGAAMLVAVGLAPSLPALIAASLLLGVATIVPQLAVPFAAASVPDSARGRSVGLVMSGLLVGVLLSRTVSGVVGHWLGWRTVYLGGAALMVLLAVALHLLLPTQTPPARVPWRQLVASLPSLLVEEPLVVRHAVLGALTFGAFSVFWTTLAFHLARPPLGYGSDVAGLFGVVGVAGAIAAPIAGRLADRHGSDGVNFAAIAIVAASFLLLGALGRSLVGLGLGVVVLDFGVQANHISNQTRVLGLSATRRNRVNTLYMVGYFAGGALGSTVGTAAFAAHGWTGVCAVGGAFAAAGMVAWRLLPRPRSRAAATVEPS